MRDVYGEMRAMAHDIPVYMASDSDRRIGVMPPHSKRACDVLSDAYAVVVRARAAAASSDDAEASDYIREAAELLEDAWRELNPHGHKD